MGNRIAANRLTMQMPVEQVRALASVMPPRLVSLDDAEIDVTHPGDGFYSHILVGP